MIGEIGGPDEAEAARWCKLNMKKPIVGFIAGVTAPAGKRMGHAGALISGGADTADAKLAIMEECGFKVTRNPSEMAKLLKATPLSSLYQKVGPEALRLCFSTDLPKPRILSKLVKVRWPALGQQQAVYVQRMPGRRTQRCRSAMCGGRKRLSTT
jgi:hypothetical protein